MNPLWIRHCILDDDLDYPVIVYDKLFAEDSKQIVPDLTILFVHEPPHVISNNVAF